MRAPSSGKHKVLLSAIMPVAETNKSPYIALEYTDLRTKVFALTAPLSLQKDTFALPLNKFLRTPLKSNH